MTDWRIQIPTRRPTDTLADMASNAAALPPDDRAVTRELVAVAAMAGIHNAERLAMALEAMSPTERRSTFDKLRKRAGLETTAESESRQRFGTPRYRCIPRPFWPYSDGK
jgi:hypothetical protein